MNFIPLSKYLDSFHKVYELPGCDCCIYENHNNVFRRKYGFSDAKKTTFKDLYFMHSAAKLICCTAIVRLSEEGKLSLSDRVDKYIPGFGNDSTVEQMLRIYSETLDFEQHKFNHKNLSRIVEALTGLPLDEYLHRYIFEPLHMKNTSFSINDSNRKRISTQYFLTDDGERLKSDKSFEALLSKNEGCIITSVGDYARFAETLCNKGVSKHGFRLLSEEGTLNLINNIIYNETTEKNCFVCIGYNGSLVSIDIDNKVTIIYAQHVKNCGTLQMEIYPKLRELAYDCLGVHKWSKGFNVFP
ncbi:MAG: class A beta-lactamase-related serine hydrolase [Clostridiales bacterium]|nr:class A beta-lactamase-related serine hydrolase [Clostridiales bacterium]